MTAHWDPRRRAFGIHMIWWWLAGIWADHVRLALTSDVTKLAGFTIEESVHDPSRSHRQVYCPSLNRYSKALQCSMRLEPSVRRHSFRGQFSRRADPGGRQELQQQISVATSSKTRITPFTIPRRSIRYDMCRLPVPLSCFFHQTQSARASANAVNSSSTHRAPPWRGVVQRMR